MKALLVFLVAPWVVFLLPWAVPAYQRRWARAALFFVAWAGAILIAALLWSGPGIALFGLTVLVALLTTKIEVD